MKSNAYMPFWGWLVLCGLMGFGGFLLWHYNLWHQMLKQDQTYLSGVIMLLFLATTLYLGHSAWRLARETRESNNLNQRLHQGKIPSSWTQQHLSLLLQLQQNQTAQTQGDTLQARLIEQVHGGHQTGWFMADLLLRLGLVGTVIGFVLMLGAVYGLEENAISALKQLLTSMGGGMQVALYTTLTGLGAATLLSIQCHWLDRCADRLVSRIIEMGVTDLSAFAMQVELTDTNAATNYVTQSENQSAQIGSTQSGTVQP